MHKSIFIKKAAAGGVILRGLCCYCVTAAVLKLFTRQSFLSVEGFAEINFMIPPSIFAVCFGLCTLLRVYRNIPLERYLLPLSFGLYSFLTLRENKEIWFTLALSALWAVLIRYYADAGWLCCRRPMRKSASVVLTCCAVLLFILIVGAQGVYRYLTFTSPNFDFGIFCNLYYHFRKEFLPLTTCERDRLLSHFAVHLSPVLYLLTPIYALFPHPVTLQVMQAAILGSAAFPLYLIVIKYGCSRRKAFLFALLLLLHPAVGNGANYDFHENCFLLPLLMWMFFFFERGRVLPFFGCAGLTLLVKEDAAVYVIFFALYIVIERKKYLLGGLTGGAAILYFIFALTFLSVYGEGVMSGRYGNYIPEGGGLMQAVHTVLLDPAYILTQLFSDENGPSFQKWIYLSQMLLPLGLIPLFCKKPARLILLCPMVLVNLMTLYAYQFQIGFQYSFGPAAFLCYLAVLNLPDMQPKAAKTALGTALVISLMLFFITTLTYTEKYRRDYETNREKYCVMEEALQKIPDDAAVVCSTCLLPHLSQREVIYEDKYHTPSEEERLDYILIDLRYDHEEVYETYLSFGYSRTCSVEYNGKALLWILTPENAE